MAQKLVSYSPPKSAIWGHQAGRFRATELANLLLRFLDERCKILSASAHDFTIFLGNLDSSVATPESIAAAKLVIVDGPAEVTTIAQGMLCIKSVKPQPVERIMDIARNFENLVDTFPNVLAASVIMMNWIFAWKNEPDPVLPLISAGGMFSIIFGKPNRVSTRFTFRNLADYFSIKDFLTEIGMCNLSDKNVRPKKLIDEWNRQTNP